MSDKELITMFQILLTEMQRRLLPEPEPPKPQLFPQTEESQPLAEKTSRGVVVPRDRYTKNQLILWRKDEQSTSTIAKIIDVLENGDFMIRIKGLREDKQIPADQIVGLYLPD
jgi:hypothetical protein